MDPIALASVTSALVVLAVECAKGIAGSAGKDLWGEIKSKFGWQLEPNLSELAQQIATNLNENEALAEEIVSLLKRLHASHSSAGILACHIDIRGKNVVTASIVNISGDLKMS